MSRLLSPSPGEIAETFLEANTNCKQLGDDAAMHVIHWVSEVCGKKQIGQTVSFETRFEDTVGYLPFVIVLSTTLARSELQNSATETRKGQLG